MGKKKMSNNLVILYLSTNPSPDESSTFYQCLQEFLLYLKQHKLNNILILLSATQFDSKKSFRLPLDEHFVLMDNQPSHSLKIIEKNNYEHFVFMEIKKNIWLFDFDHLLTNTTNDKEALLTYHPERQENGYLINQRQEPVKDEHKEYHDCFVFTGIYTFTKHVLTNKNKVQTFRDVTDELLKGKPTKARLAGGPSVSLTSSSSLTTIKKWSQRKPCLFLDRDGVINHDTRFPSNFHEFKIFPEIMSIIRWAQEKNWHLVVVTNQSGIAKGIFNEKKYLQCTKDFIEYFKEHKITFDLINHCPYHPEGKIPSYKKPSLLRKPNPGMILATMNNLAIDLHESIMIGDKDSDEIKWMNLKTFFIKGKYALSKDDNVFPNHHELFEHLKKMY